MPYVPEGATGPIYINAIKSSRTTSHVNMGQQSNVSENFSASIIRE
jgi:hypothetical protein